MDMKIVLCEPDNLDLLWGSDRRRGSFFGESIMKLRNSVPFGLSGILLAPLSAVAKAEWSFAL